MGDSCMSRKNWREFRASCKTTRFCRVTFKVAICMNEKLKYYAEFLASPYCCNIAKKTWKHQLLIRTFLEKKKKKKRAV